MFYKKSIRPLYVTLMFRYQKLSIVYSYVCERNTFSLAEPEVFFWSYELLCLLQEGTGGAGVNMGPSLQ